MATAEKDFVIALRVIHFSGTPLTTYFGKIGGICQSGKRLSKRAGLIEIRIDDETYPNINRVTLYNRLSALGNECSFQNEAQFREELDQAVTELRRVSALPTTKPPKHVGPMPVFERQTSVCTNQGQEGTCYAHSTSKIILQNIYLFVNPINVQDKEKFHSCFDVLKTDIEHDYTHLSVEKCGIGYFKILLFLYAYFITKSTPIKLVSDFVSRSVEMPDIEQFKGKIKMNFDALRKRIQDKIESRGLIWTTFRIVRNPSSIPLLTDFIPIILKLGFYIYVHVEHPTFPSGHAVVIVNHRKEAGQDYFAISNSWGDYVDITTNLTKITLRGKVCSITEFVFVLPFCTKNTPTTPLPPSLTLYNLRDWMLKYEQDIKAFKSQVFNSSSGGKTKRRKKSRKIKK